MYLTRHGGPIFKHHQKAVIVFDYPIHGSVKDFYTKRAADFGLDVTIEAKVYHGSFKFNTDRHILSLGGGKDSRFIAGMLREQGKNPVFVTAGKVNARGVEGALTTTPLDPGLTTRIIPALMMLPRYHYMGLVLFSARRVTPWQQYFDIGSPTALKDFSKLLKELGMQTDVISPTCPLATNIIQMMLHRRYPDLAKNQRSVVPGVESEKNLHIALCKMRHGIPFDDHCSAELFKRLLQDFVERNIANPNDFGFHLNRELHIRETRSMICELREHPLFDQVREKIPESWHEQWFDYVHSYVMPDLPPEFLDIYYEYLPDISECPQERVYRVPV